MKVTKGEIYWRMLAGSASAVTFVLLLANLKVARQFFTQVDDFGDFSIIAVPVSWTIIALAASIAVAFLPARPGIAQGVLRGTFVGVIVFLPLIWMAVYSIGGPGDGLAYWATVALPTFWLGTPLILVGGLVGAKFSGAPIHGLLVSVIAIVLLFRPISLAVAYLGKFAERLFILVFA